MNLSELLPGMYVKWMLSPQSRDAFNKIALELDDCTPPNHLHMTIIYSLDWFGYDGGVIFQQPERAKIMKPIILPRRSLATNCLALELECPGAKERFDDLRSQGARHDHPGFLAHMTLIRECSADFTLPSRVLKMLPEYVEFNQEVAVELKKK